MLICFELTRRLFREIPLFSSKFDQTDRVLVPRDHKSRKKHFFFDRSAGLFSLVIISCAYFPVEKYISKFFERGRRIYNFNAVSWISNASFGQVFRDSCEFTLIGNRDVYEEYFSKLCINFEFWDSFVPCRYKNPFLKKISSFRFTRLSFKKLLDHKKIPFDEQIFRLSLSFPFVIESSWNISLWPNRNTSGIKLSIS